jgi:hypothetical protein
MRQRVGNEGKMTNRKILDLNFHVAVWFSIIAGVVVLNFPDLIIQSDDGLYGPLRNNILIAIGYLLFGQIGLWYFCYLRGRRAEALFMGYTFLATAVGVKVYGEINGLPVSMMFVAALVYVAVSHGLYFFAGRGGEGTATAEKM